MADFKNLSNSAINLDLLKDMPVRNPTQELIDGIQSDQNRMLRNIQHTREVKEAEELRRHNELIETLKTAGENGATIVIGDNANAVQVQQNTSGSSQDMVNTQIFNYEKTLEVLKEIQGYVNFPQFQDTFKDDSETIMNLINESIKAVETKQEPSLIKKSLNLMKDLAIRAGGSLIASGILALLNTIPM